MSAAEKKNGSDPLADLQEALKTAQSDSSDAQNRLKVSTDKTTALQRALDDIAKSQDATAKQRDTVQKELDDAIAMSNSMCEELEAQLSDQYRQAIGDLRDKVDQNIADLDAQVQKLTGELDTAQKNATNANGNVAQTKAAFDSTAAKLKQFPADLTAGKDRIVKVKTAMKSAFDAGKAIDAYYQSKELDAALQDAKGYLDPGIESKWLADLSSQWTALASAMQASGEANTALDQAKAKLAAAKQELAQAQKGREASVRQQLDDLAKNPPAGDGGAPKLGKTTAPAQYQPAGMAAPRR